MLSDIEMETFELLIEVLDHNDFLANALIGSVAIGLGTMHRNMNHEFHKIWLSLVSPKNVAEERVPSGRVLVDPVNRVIFS